MSRKSLKPEERKVKITIRLHPKLYSNVKLESNMSKYIEYLIYCDLKNKKIIGDILL